MALQLTPALEERLDQLAASTHRSTDELAQEGLETFLDHEERRVSISARGRAEIAAGQVVDHADVVARFARLTKAQ